MTIDIERIKHKIRSLLARNVQNGASIAEAEICLEKAYKMLAEFNLDIEELLKDTDENTKKIVEEQVFESGNISPELSYMISSISWLFHCEAIICRRPVMRSKYRRCFVNIVGNPINVEKVKYFITLFDETLRRLIKFDEITGLRNINSYKRGFYKAISHKADTLRSKEEMNTSAQNTGSSNALIALDKQNLDNFLKDRKIRTHSVNYNNFGKSTNTDMHSKGYTHGQGVNFNDPLGYSREQITCKH